MIVTTSSSIKGKQIAETFGLVMGNTIRAKWIGKDIVSGIRQLVGGELVEYTDMLSEAREEALQRMIVEAKYHKLCTVNELEENQTIVVETKGKNILVAKIEGEFFAIENTCTHENLPLNGGEIFQGQIQCPHHGARFDIKTGKATQFPAVMELKTYQIKIENDNVLVAL